MIKEYNIEVDCANCANEMEETVLKIKGIKKANVNFIMKKLKIEFNDNIKEEDIKNIMLNAKKLVHENDEDTDIYI